MPREKCMEERATASELGPMPAYQQCAVATPKQKPPCRPDGSCPLRTLDLLWPPPSTKSLCWPCQSFLLVLRRDCSKKLHHLRYSISMHKQCLLGCAVGVPGTCPSIARGAELFSHRWPWCTSMSMYIFHMTDIDIDCRSLLWHLHNMHATFQTLQESWSFLSILFHNSWNYVFFFSNNILLLRHYIAFLLIQTAQNPIVARTPSLARPASWANVHQGTGSTETLR